MNGFRPSPRSLFLEPIRRLNLKFYTSNVQKYLQAKTVLDKFGLILQYFRSRTEPYNENYELGKERLLIDAIDEIKKTVGRGSLFFVEDTSLRIDALSNGEQDFPGLAVKEWFANTTFAELNKQLSKDPNGRRAVVKSDIALHVPGLDDPVIFHGETVGKLATTSPQFDENPQYPWLTPNSFNGWFVPDNAARRLGEMSFEESLEHDFRVRALIALVRRLEEYAAVLNCPSECYVTVVQPSGISAQPPLFKPHGRALVVVGRTCAGKTTFGSLAADHLPGLKVIEASDVLRSLMRKIDENLTPLEFAKRVLTSEGPDVIARRIINMYRLDDESNFLITGFRTIEELEIIRSLRPDAKIVLVDALSRTRYARYLARGRGPNLSYEEFTMHDSAQWAFGLLRVAEDLADVRVINEGSLEDYRNQISAIIADPVSPAAPSISVNIHPRHQLYAHRLFRCLAILEENNRPMTCVEIEELSSKHQLDGNNQSERFQTIRRYSGKRITHNNVNKVLKAVPELAQRIEAPGSSLHYSITGAGRAYVHLMLLNSDRVRNRN